MTPNQMRAKAKKLEAEGGNQDQINMLLDRANEEERKAYEADRKGGNYKEGGMISEYGGKEKYKSKAAMKKHEAKESKSEEKMEKGMHMMPDGKMMKDSAHKKPKKPKKMMGGGTMSYKHGGSVDGCAVRGKTKGRVV